MKFFVAEIQTRHTSSHAYGEYPADAVEALVRRWKEDYAPHSHADPEHLSELREEMEIFQVELGKGYVIGPTDAFARELVARGDHPMFDEAFAVQASAPRP